MAKSKRKAKPTVSKAKAKATKGKVVKLSSRKASPAKPAKKLNLGSLSIKQAQNQSQIIATLSEHSGVPKKDVKVLLEVLSADIAAHMKGAGKFVLAGLLKIMVIRKPATKARKGINPFTGEETTFKARPARNVVKIRALKILKAMV